MARRRKQETAEMKVLREKIDGMKAIDRSYDTGNNVTLAAAEELLERGVNSLGESNQALATADDKDNIFKDINKEIRSFNKKVLPAAGLKYGTDSSEYEMLGGKRESERKKRTVKPKADK